MKAKSLCTADETRLLNFLRRVGLALNEVKPKRDNDLGTLNGYKPGVTYADERREKNPMIASVGNANAECATIAPIQPAGGVLSRAPSPTPHRRRFLPDRNQPPRLVNVRQ